MRTYGEGAVLGANRWGLVDGSDFFVAPGNGTVFLSPTAPADILMMGSPMQLLARLSCSHWRRITAQMATTLVVVVKRDRESVRDR